MSWGNELLKNINKKMLLTNPHLQGLVDEQKNTKTKKINKFNAVITEYNGRKYASIAEARYRQQLDLVVLSNSHDKPLKIEEQVKYRIMDKDGQKVLFSYILDFRVTYSNRIEHIDVKGCKMGAAYTIFKNKKKLVEDQYGITIIEKGGK